MQKPGVPLQLLEVQHVLYRYLPENFAFSVNTIYTAHLQHFLVYHVSLI